MQHWVPTDLAARRAVVRAEVVGPRGRGISGEEAKGRFFAARHGHEKPVLNQRPPVVIHGVPDKQPLVLEVVGGEIGNPLIVSGCGIRHDSVKVGPPHVKAKARLVGDEASVGL